MVTHHLVLKYLWIFEYPIRADELDDDALSDGGDDGMTDEQHGQSRFTPKTPCLISTYVGQMIFSLEQVKTILGDEDVSGLSDQTLKDCLWEYFFDVEKTLQWAAG